MLCTRCSQENIIFSRFLSRKRAIYISLLEKAEGDLLEKKKNAFHKKIFEVSESVFKWYSDKHYFLSEKVFP